MRRDDGSYDLVAIRDHLFAAFSHQPEAFRRLFFYTDHAGLRPLRNRLSPGHSLEAQVEVVLEYCEKQDLLADLLTELQRYDPGQYTPVGPLPAYTPPPLPDPGVLPEPGELPPGSRLPFPRNALFTGREGPLLALARALLHDPAGSSTLVTQTIEGMGGIGKTQLAVEFAYRYGRYFHGVHWLNAAQPDLIGAEVAACGAEMGLEPWPAELPDQVRRTLAAWEGEGPRLVVLDNLEAAATAGEWLPRLDRSGVRPLITARRRDWPLELGLAPLSLEVFSPEESRAYLRRYLQEGRAGDEDLDALAVRLGHLPLALRLAGRYLARLGRLTVAEYVAGLDDLFADPAMLNWRAESALKGHDLDLAASCLRSWQEVKEEAARQLFLLAGYCAPNQPIPCELLEAALEAGSSASLRERIARLFRKAREPLDFDEALALLTGLGLLEMDDPIAGPAIHPLLAEYARTLPGAGEEVLSRLAGGLAPLASEASQTGLPAKFAPLRPHVEAVAPAAEAAGWDGAGGLWNSLGYHLNDVADYRGARAALERALAIDEVAFGPEHPNVAIRVNNLGGVLYALGNLAGARAAYERALAIDEATYGSEHHSVAILVNNLGNVLRDLGELAEARAAFERALAIEEAVHGSEHPNVAIGVNSLGMVLKAQGELAGARAAFERALGIDEATYGPEHPKVAIRVNNLGSVLKAQGELAGAQAAFERALAIDQRTYGSQHPNVARDVNNLGMVLRAQGELAGARAAFERALGIDEAVYGPEHPNVARDVNNLGSVLQAQGEHAGARAAYERALAIFEQFLPADHPHIALVRKNLKTCQVLTDAADAAHRASAET